MFHKIVLLSIGFYIVLFLSLETSYELNLLNIKNTAFVCMFTGKKKALKIKNTNFFMFIAKEETSNIKRRCVDTRDELRVNKYIL